MSKVEVRYELLKPGQLDQIVRESPIAYLPLGSLEWHGDHLPLGNDAIKAYEICLRAARVTGGVVLPPLWYGAECLKLRATGTRDGTIDVDYHAYKAFLVDVLRRVVKQGFRVVIVLTGHYSREQVYAAKQAAREVEQVTRDVEVKGTAQVRIIALPEYELATDIGYRGDHAAKWETSILMYLRPDLVDYDKISAKPGIQGESPEQATRDLGEKVVNLIVERLVQAVRQALQQVNSKEH